MQMTDEQVLTAAIAIVVPVAALIYSNSRITDTKETLRAEMKLMKAEIINEIQALRTDIKTALAEMKTAVKVHELEHHK